MFMLYTTTLQAPHLNKQILIMMTAGDKINIMAQIATLKKIAIDYKGKTIDNIIQQLELRLADSNLRQLKS